MAMSTYEVQMGTVTGTGQPVTISVGFPPDYVKVVNITDGNQMWEWFTGMGAGQAIQSQSGSSNQFTRLNANGITISSGAAPDTPAGFIIGTAVSVNGRTLSWIAMRRP